MQFFQGDQVRGIGGIAEPNPGRRVLAREMHDTPLTNPDSGGPPASVAVAADGSIAAFVPARRAMAWALTDAAGTPVIRERVWVTFQPGEIRVCAACHGTNSVDQAGQNAPTNSPEALRSLLRSWSNFFSDGFESGDLTAWSNQVGN
jgi:hypothetical protein